jgi:hypothetical protein
MKVGIHRPPPQPKRKYYFYECEEHNCSASYFKHPCIILISDYEYSGHSTGHISCNLAMVCQDKIPENMTIEQVNANLKIFIYKGEFNGLNFGDNSGSS